MTKAATKILCLIFLLAAPALRAQQTDDAISVATGEAIRRQANAVKLGKLVDAAAAARQRNDLEGAARLYEEGSVLAKGVSPDRPEYQKLVTGRSAVLLELARQDQKQGRPEDADEKFNRILAMDPANQEVLTLKRDNMAAVNALAGTKPHIEVQQQAAAFQTNKIEAATLVQDGKTLLEAGRPDEAESRLRQAVKLDPSNVAAYQYLRLVDEKRTANGTKRNEVISARAMVMVEDEWNVDQRTAHMLPRPNSFARSNVVYTGKGRQAIISKLERTRVETVKFPGLELKEVLNSLSKTSKDRDAEGKGINFFIVREAGPVSSVPDPTTGLLTAGEQPDISDAKIQVSLEDVRLADVLDAITKTSDRPIKYSVLDYAVVFSARTGETLALETRTFHIDPNTFQQGLESVVGISFGATGGTTGGGGGGGNGGGGGGNNGGGGGGNNGGGGGAGSGGTLVPQVSVTGGSIGGGGGGGFGGNFGGGGGGGGRGGGGGGINGGGGGGSGLRFVTSQSNTTDVLQGIVRNFFVASGVDLSTNSGKAVFFNDRNGKLTVRATSQDLDLIETAIQTLNQSPPLVNIKSKFAEITQNDSRAVNFNLILGNFVLGGNTIGSGGTQPSFAGPSNTIAGNPNGFFPGTAYNPSADGVIPGANTLIAPALSDGNLTGGLRNPLNTPAIATFTGILTDPQFRVVISALEQRDGTEVLTSPEVTTESGRQAQMQAIDIKLIVTQNQAQGLGGGNQFAGTQTGVNAPIVSAPVAFNPTTSSLPFGPTLDVIPYVSADEFSVQMTLIPSVTEFLGYDTQTAQQFVPTAALPTGQTITATLPLPIFRVRQITTSVTVWDSQTLVLGGLMTDSVSRQKDRVPMLGDMPFVGRFFRSESFLKTKKNLMVFVTPTIINPDGTRYHSDEEMPFLQAAGVLPAKPITP